MTRKKCTCNKSKRVIRIIEIPFDDIIEEEINNDVMAPPVGLYYWNEAVGTIKAKAPISELATLQKVFPDMMLLKHMDAGRLYDYGMEDVTGEAKAAYIVKLYIDKELVLTEYDRNYEKIGNDENAVCIIVPAEKLETWMEK